MNDSERDPVYESDRVEGSTAPESGSESSNVVGRPTARVRAGSAFHEGTELDKEEREAFSTTEADAEGGSYDGLGVPTTET